MAERQLPELRSRLRLDTSDLIRAKASAKQFTATMAGPINTKSLDAFATKAGKIGGQLTRSITLPVLAVGAASAKLALDFDTAFTKIATTTDVPASAIGGLRDQVLQLAKTTGQMPKDLANALLLIERSGVGPAHAMDVLNSAAKAAALGLGDVSDISNTITAAMHIYGSSVLSAGRATDVLVAAAKEGKAGIDEFGPQLGRLLPIAKDLHLGFDQVAGSLAFLSRGGGGAGQAGAQLFQVLTKMEKLTPAAAKALKGVGISADDIRKSLAENGLIATLQLLQDALGGSTKDLAKLFGGGRSIAGVFALMGDGGKGAAAGIDKVSKSAGAATTAFDILDKTDPQKAKKALASLEASGIQLGEKLLPALTQLGTGIADLAGVFSHLPKPLQAAVIDFTLLAAATGPLIKGVGLGAKGLSALTRGAEAATVATEGEATATAGLTASLGPIAIALAGVYGLYRGFSEFADRKPLAEKLNLTVDPSALGLTERQLAHTAAAIDALDSKQFKGQDLVSLKAMKAAVDATGGKSIPALNKAIKEGEAAAARAADRQAKFGSATDDVAASVESEINGLTGLHQAMSVSTDDVAKFADAARGSFDAHMAEVDAVDSLTQAQSDLADARKNAGPDSDQMIQALRAERDAVKGVSDAKRESLAAEVALDKARVDAREHLVELKNAAVDAALAEKGAELDLAEAKRKVQEGNFDSPIDKQRADLAVQTATQAVTEAQQKATQAATESKDANAKGVEGSDEVVAAKQRVADAADGEKAAQERLADSTKAVTKVQTDSAKAVKDAQDQVTKASLGVAEAHAAVLAQVGNVKGANDALIGGLADLARSLDPANPVRKNIDAFLAQLLHIKQAYDSISGTPTSSAQTGTAIPPTRDPDVGPRLPTPDHHGTGGGLTKGLRVRVPTLTAPAAPSGPVVAGSNVVHLEQHIHIDGDLPDPKVAQMKEVARSAAIEAIRQAPFSGGPR